ncbi:glycosyltransferase family 61 protein [Defluviimonas salinarum]|uniref:Glycosyltransferase family 61 protein n=1 Tax=Defluviimonas salinarum TaxID=2992147 RepID=A0ABT3IXL1_9RHOB|nr:glycosyltransferase family 61 protein [Defluviimonas salinarum]MCW3780182.1 glycosyltransferase family 61 protein [Defluviimonas salinarum]
MDGDFDYAHAALWRFGKRFTQPLSERPVPVEKWSGRHIWGGLFFGNFGHFLMETISRLWIRGRVDAESVLFVPRHDALTDFKGYQSALYELLDIGIPARIVTDPVEVDELIVPGQGFGLGRISRATPEFKDLLNVMAASIEPNGPEKLYISRTQFGGQGGVLSEACLEANMEALGYTVIHPQRLSLPRQLALYKAAKHVVGLDGSAFHLFGFVAREDQRAAIVLRRNSEAFTAIATQLESFMGHPPVIINALAADWMPETQNFANHQTWGELDFSEVGRCLGAGGFIKKSDVWCAPTKAQLAEAVDMAATKAKTNLKRRASQVNT